MLRVMGYLARILQVVEGDKKPAMVYIHETMDGAKEAIKKGIWWK